MMARPMVTQEAWKNNHHADNAEEDDGEIDDDEGKNYDGQYESFVGIIKQMRWWNSLFYSQEIVLKWWQ